MLAKVMLTGLYMFLIFWVLQAAYVLWWAYRNNAFLEGRAHSERV